MSSAPVTASATWSGADAGATTSHSSTAATGSPAARPSSFRAGSAKRLVLLGGLLERLAQVVADQRARMPGANGLRFQRCQLAQRLLRLLVVPVEGGVGDRRLSLGQLLQTGGIHEVNDVADDGQPVGLAPEPDQPGGVAGEVDDLEARDLVALGDGVVDLHGAAVPAAQ